MNRRDFDIGPGAASLMLIAVVLCMSVLGVLSLSSARSDAELGRRSVAMAQATGAMSAAVERDVAELDALLLSSADAETEEAYLEIIQANLPAGMTLVDREVSWEASSEDGVHLDCAVEIAPLGAFPRMRWTSHRLWTEIIEEGGLEVGIWS